ncbi:MAG: VCBS repeat-containing protein [Deltaproteobacteria bacterium]|nr:VCBS repeat-containing protein [Deltaproteobacteria bacterium]
MILLSLSSLALATFPLPLYPECGEPDRPDLCPADLGEEWSRLSYVPSRYTQVREEERPMGTGLWADRAWRVTTGRPDVLIAVLDSGIEWDSRGVVNKHFLNRAELPLPWIAQDTPASDYDANGDGVFNIRDWDLDPRVDPTAGVDPADGMLDPSDLIATFSDGHDDDGNGYIDDISGWDFFWNDNDPYDDTRFGHGTGEAENSMKEGDDGQGGIGVCPSCTALNLRVGDSFIADGQRFAQATLYATDMGAVVVQEALGGLNNSDYVRDAVEYAWDHGVTIIGSAADETAYHQNMPGNNHHTVYVHAIRYDADSREDSVTFQSYSNCSNHGARLMLSAPHQHCSSGAVGVSAGVAGLMYAAALDAGITLTANEAQQLLTMTADEINWPDAMAHQVYPSGEGWDLYYGYGRINADRVVRAVRDGDIPPEADLLSPDWFELLDPLQRDRVSIEGIARASRSQVARWSLQVGVGVDPSEDDFVEISSGTEAAEGVLGELDLSTLGGSEPLAAYTAEMGQIEREEEVNRYTVTLRLQVVDEAGRLGEQRKAVYVHADPDLRPGFPVWIGDSMEGAPTLYDMDGDGVLDVVLATGGGRVMVLDGEGSPLPGWPVTTALVDALDPADPANHLGSPAAAAVGTEAWAPVLSAPAVGDLDGDGQPEVVVATLRGEVLAWDAAGQPLDGFPVFHDPVPWTDAEHPWDRGFFSTPALGDLDGDGALEVVVGGMDGKLYAWHGDGAPVGGFPVLLDKSDWPLSDRLVSSPALGDLDGDGLVDIAIGGSEINDDATQGVLWAVDGEGQVLQGWPVIQSGLLLETLPYIGHGIPGSPAMGDVDGDGTLEVISHPISGDVVVYQGDGSELLRGKRSLSAAGSKSNATEAAFFPLLSSTSLGDLDGDGVLDLVTPATGYGYLEGLLDDGRYHRFEHGMMACSGVDGDPLRGFPQVMEDLQFFLNPVLGDVDGDGEQEVVGGSGGFTLHAWNADGDRPDGWPRFTGQWLITSPAIGDIDGDGYMDVVAGTRNGWLFVWDTPSPAGADTSWPMWGHDAANTNNHEAPLWEGYNTGYTVPREEEEDPKGCGCAAGGLSGGLVPLLLGLLATRRRR